MERPPPPSDQQSAQPQLKAIRTSPVARVLAAILATLLLAAMAAAVVLALISFTVFSLVLVPLFLLLLVLGRGRFNVYVLRRFRTPQETGRPPKPDQNH